MSIAADHLDEEGWHLVLSTGRRRYRLNNDGETSDTGPLVYVLPGDALWETRQAGFSAFHEHCHLGLIRKLPLCPAPGPSEHWRLVQWLWLLDALSGGATTRESAIELIAATKDNEARFYLLFVGDEFHFPCPTVQNLCRFSSQVAEFP